MPLVVPELHLVFKCNTFLRSAFVVFGFQVPTDPLVSNSEVHAEIAPPTYLCLVASQGSKLHEERHKGHEVYTSSGHHCGVIPYSSLWHGGLPQGLMMNNTRKNCLARGVLVLVVLSRVQLPSPLP